MKAARRQVYGGDGLGAWWRGHARASREAAERLVSTPAASALTITVFGLALLLPLLLAVGLANAQRFAKTIETVRELGVFLEPHRDAAFAASLKAAWIGRIDVERVSVRTPEQGLAEFRQMSDLADAIDLLEGNPLPYVLVVVPRDDPAALAAALAAAPGVDSVQYDAAWRERLDAWLQLAQRLAFLLAALLSIAMVLIVGNTVRLDLGWRRDEIALLQQLGADDADIRRPLVYSGIYYGVLAGGLALAGMYLIGAALSAPLAALVATYAGDFPITGPGWPGAATLVALAAAFGWLGARLAAGQHLRDTRPTEL